MGSEPTAAGGGRKEASEWQRSIKSRFGVSPKILSGTATGSLLGYSQPASIKLRKHYSNLCEKNMIPKDYGSNCSGTIL